MLSNAANQPPDNAHRPENNSHPPTATGQIEGNQAGPPGPLDSIPLPADPPNRPESQLVVDVKDVTKSSAKSPSSTSTASSSSPKPANSPSSSSGPSKEAQKFNHRVALHQQLYAKFFKNLSEGRPMNDPKEDPFPKRNSKASSSSPSPRNHHRSQSEATRKSSSCRPSMERTNSPFARPSSSRSGSTSAKGSSANSPSGSPKMKPKSSRNEASPKPSTSSRAEVPKSNKHPEVSGTAGSSSEKVEQLEVKKEVKTEVEELPQATAKVPVVEKTEIPEVKAETIALPESPVFEAPAVVEQVVLEATKESSSVSAIIETIPVPKMETVVSSLVDSIPMPQEAQPIKTPEVVEEASTSASLTPADTDSGEERTPTETKPAQKSDASPSTASFTSSRSASPARQDSVEEVPEEAPVSEGTEPVEQLIEQKPARSRGKKGRANKRAPKEGNRKKLTAAERHRLAREQKIEKAVKRQEKHRQRTLRWYFIRVLEFGVQTMDLSEKIKKKLRTYIKKRLHEDSKYLTVQINLDTRFCDDGDYRRCRQYFLDTTCKTVAPKRSADDEEEDETGAKVAKTEKGGRSTSRKSKKKIPANVPLFSLYGDLFVPIDISAKQLMERAGKRMQTGRNEVFRSERSTCYPKVTPPRPDPNFLDEEMAYFRAMMQNGENEEMRKVMEKFEGIDAIRIPCPELPVRTPEDVHDERFKRILLSTSITNVDGFGKALGIDFSKFTIEAIMEAHPELVMDELYQCPQSANHNYDPDGDETWYAKSENRAVKVKTFGADYIKRRNIAIETVNKFIASDDWAKAEEEITKSFLENRYCHPQDDQTMFFTRFGTNIDIQHPEKFEAQLDEIDKLPEFMQPEREGNLINLSYVGQEIFGVNTVQMYVKPPGARTCAHMENALMASINWNLGPGTCVWYAVPYEYYGRVRELVEYHKQQYFYQNYWPDEQELLAEGIPVIKFEQKADQLVYVNTGCFHWVQSNGFCANVSWNVGQPNFVQLATTMISYSDDLFGAHQHHFPLIATTWRYAQQKLFLDDPEMSKVVRSILLRSFAHSKMKYDSAVAAGIEVIYREDRPSFMHMNRCFQCMQEIFNFITWWVVPTNVDPFLSIEKNRQEREREAAEKAEKLKNQEEIIEFPSLSKQIDLPEKYCAFCDKCSKVMHRDYAGTFRTETTMYYSCEEMSEIFDGYRTTPLP